MRSCRGRPAASSAWRARRQQRGFNQVIGFDMGGTSTDVSHFAGEFERRYETEVAGVRLRAPMMNIHTVAAGGGSICRFDGSAVSRRPGVGRGRSRDRPAIAAAGRSPSPTATSCWARCSRIFSRRVRSRRRPAARCRDRRAQIRRTGRRGGRGHWRAAVSPREIAEGFLRSPSENMANAIKTDLGPARL